MFFRAFCICVFISVTHQQFLRHLPTSDDLRNSKVNNHKQTLCMIKVGSEICYNGSKSPGDAEEVAELFKIIKYGRLDKIQNMKHSKDSYESASDDDNYSEGDDDGYEEDDDDYEEDEDYYIRKL